MTPDGKRAPNDKSNENASQTHKTDKTENSNAKPTKEDDFFDLLTRSQSKRMDDQRCSLKTIGHSLSQPSRENPRKPLVQQNSLPAIPATPAKDNRNALLEMIADLQSERMDEQRAMLPGLIPSPRNMQQRRERSPILPQGAAREPDDAFIDMLMRCQGSRLEEQRSELPRPGVTFDVEQGEPPNNNRRNCVNHNTVAANAGATVPDEDFFSLIMRVQGGRMEDQRAAVRKTFSQNICLKKNSRFRICFQVPFKQTRSNPRSNLNPDRSNPGKK